MFGKRRLAAANSLPDWEDLRTQARSIKDHTLLNLEKYLEEFTANAERSGAQIHWARDAAEANEIVKRLARERGARLVVKSKSMTTEEIHLNAALEAAGIEALETDLGEYIIQLAGETPSHIIAPAIHKTRDQIADLFVEKLGIAPTDDIPTLTITARRVLREKFGAADIGISGVNFGVAETGTILILENEGNIRLTTSLPQNAYRSDGYRKSDPALRRSRSVSKAVAALGYGPASDRLSIIDYRNQTRRRQRRAGRVAHNSARQRPLANVGPSDDAAIARVHSLWRVPERVSGLSADRRARLWLGLSGANRRSHHAAVDWFEQGGEVAIRVESVRRLP